MKIAVSYRLSALTLRQLQELSERWGMTKTETISVIVDRAYRQEVLNMRTVTVRNEQELRDALTAAGLTPSPLPELPVEVAGLRIEWAKDFYEKKLRPAYDDSPILVAVVQNGVVTEEFTRIPGGEGRDSGAPWGTLGLSVEELHERGFRKAADQSEHPGA